MGKNYYRNHYHNTSNRNSSSSNGSKKGNCQLVALDTNVFIRMSHNLKGNNGRDKNETLLIKRLEAMRKKADKGLIKFVITPSVLGELTQGQLTKTEKYFLRKYCVVLQPKNEVEFAVKTAKLMKEYIGKGVMESPKTRYGDARIMAECTIAGLNLLSDNYKDFVIYGEVHDNYRYDQDGDFVPKGGYSEKNIPSEIAGFSEKQVVDYLRYKKRDRALSIGVINDEQGYSYVNKKGYKVTPMPFTSMDYIGKNPSKQGLWKTAQFAGQYNSQEFDLTAYGNGA